MEVTGTTWRDEIPGTEWDLYRAAGYGSPGSLGGAPALLIVDVTYGFVGHRRVPVRDAIAAYPNACGESAFDALPLIGGLRTVFHRLHRPVYYSTGAAWRNGAFVGRWRDKVATDPTGDDLPPDYHEIVAEISPTAQDIVFDKAKPSAFFESPLLSSLIDRHVDSVVIAGCTTSGCVRATALDSFSYGFHTTVAEDAVFDRSRYAHAASLFDLQQKYAAVLPSSGVISQLT
jgi:maleamate amidohydrolase